MERGTGFEPATSCLEGRSSTAELPPLAHHILRTAGDPFKLSSVLLLTRHPRFRCRPVSQQLDRFGFSPHTSLQTSAMYGVRSDTGWQPKGDNAMIGLRGHEPTGTHPNKARTGRQVAQSILAAVVLCVVAVVGISCGGSSSSPTPSPSATADAPSNTVWLCRPGCRQPLRERPDDHGRITPTARAAVEQASPAENPPIDCFYVYPTVSDQTDLERRPDDRPGRDGGRHRSRHHASRRYARSTRRCTGS